jgi:hypothetical protein
MGELPLGLTHGSAFQETLIKVLAYSSAPTGITAFALVLWGLRVPESCVTFDPARQRLMIVGAGPSDCHELVITASSRFRTTTSLWYCDTQLEGVLLDAGRGVATHSLSVIDASADGIRDLCGDRGLPLHEFAWQSG